MWSIVSAVPDVASSTSVRLNGGSETTLQSTCALFATNDNTFQFEPFHSCSHSLGDVSILGLLQCHNDAAWKLEEQHLIFRLGRLQPNGLN
eukprot:g22120.t1